MKSLNAVILAAGRGTRMHSDLPKVIHEVCGQPMVHYSIEAAKQAGAQDVIVVIGYRGIMVRQAVSDVVDFVEQHDQLGTGHAVKCAAPYLSKAKDTLVLCGDTPLIKADTLKLMYEKHKKCCNGVTVLSAVLDDPYGYGRIVRDTDDTFMCITEEKDCTDEERKIQEVNSGIYMFNTEALLTSLDFINNDNKQGEYYLTDTISIIKRSGLSQEAEKVREEDDYESHT